MNDGSMFTGLMKYRNKSFWEGHKTITDVYKRQLLMTEQAQTEPF